MLLLTGKSVKGLKIENCQISIFAKITYNSNHLSITQLCFYIYGKMMYICICSSNCNKFKGKLFKSNNRRLQYVLLSMNNFQNNKRRILEFLINNQNWQNQLKICLIFYQMLLIHQARYQESIIIHKHRDYCSLQGLK